MGFAGLGLSLIIGQTALHFAKQKEPETVVLKKAEPFYFHANFGVQLRLVGSVGDAGIPRCVIFDAPGDKYDGWSYCFENGISGIRQESTR